MWDNPPWVVGHKDPPRLDKVESITISLCPDDRTYCWGFHTRCLWDKELNQASTEMNTSFLMATFGSARQYYASCWRRKIIHDFIQLWPCVLQYGSAKQDRPAVGSYDNNQSHFNSIWDLLHRKEIRSCIVNLVKSQWLGRSQTLEGNILEMVIFS